MTKEEARVELFILARNNFEEIYGQGQGSWHL
jgi:hypothetical protein